MAAEMAERVGARIREAREAKDLTQRELADRIPGKSDGTQVSKWERGQHKPSDDTLEHIAKALDQDVGWFYAPEVAADTAPLLDVLGPVRNGESQLDRIEAKLDKILDALRETPEDPAAIAEEAAAQRQAKRAATAASARASRRKAAGA